MRRPVSTDFSPWRAPDCNQLIIVVINFTVIIIIIIGRGSDWHRVKICAIGVYFAWAVAMIVEVSGEVCRDGRDTSLGPTFGSFRGGS